MVTAREQNMRLADGRVLRVLDVGRAGDPAIIFFNGTPGSRLIPDTLLKAVVTSGIHLVSYDRPGYGGSTAQRGRTIAHVVSDAASVADEFGINQFVVWGVSGGGPHALACAALLPERVVATSLIASFAPYDAPGLDWLAGMAVENVKEFSLAIAGRDELEKALIPIAKDLTATDPAEVMRAFGSLLTPPDLAMFNTNVATFLSTYIRVGLAPGVEGWVEDDLAFIRPWGIDLDSIRAPVALWQGEQDRFVPPAHARWLADAIRSADLRTFRDEGHLSLAFGRIQDPMDWVIGQLHGRPA